MEAAAETEGHKDEPEVPAESESDILVDIAPLPGRLVLFRSDLRCPHEVLPVLQASRERYSFITWYTRSGPGAGSVGL